MSDDELLTQALSDLKKALAIAPYDAEARVQRSMASSMLVIARNSSRINSTPDYEKEYWLNKVDLGPRA